MKLGKERGYVTHDELNAALPTEDFTSEQIDEFMSTLSEMGVSVVEAADGDDSSDGEEDEARASGNVSDSDVSGTDDPVRMYFAKWAVWSCCPAKVKSPSQAHRGRPRNDDRRHL